MIVDVNAHVGQWPFGFLELSRPKALVKRLGASGIGQAWVASLEGLLHRDLDAVNQRTVQRTAPFPETLVPVGVVNPLAPDWQTTFQRCVHRWKMPVVRLYPGYHGYQLDHPRVGQMFAAAAKARVVLQVVVRMEDPRTQHPLVRVPDVNLAPLQARLRAFPEVPVVLLGAMRSVSPRMLRSMRNWGLVYVEHSMLEGLGALERLMEDFSPARVLFGTHAPLFVPEAAVLKLTEAALPPRVQKALCHENARQLLDHAGFKPRGKKLPSRKPG